MLGIIIVAWILTWFSLDDLIMVGINEIFNTNFTVAVYWLMVFIVGAIICIVEHIRG